MGTQDESVGRPGRIPEGLRKPRTFEPATHRVKTILRRHRLHTVCEGARCPNIDECFRSGTATVMILGDRCSRSCRFCNIPGEMPEPPDLEEPERVAALTRELELTYLVVTSVTRDDLRDGGARQFAATIREVRQGAPDCRIEVLIPDFGGQREPLRTVLDAGPDVLNHNLETVPRLYPLVRPQAEYRRSLELLCRAAGETSPAKIKTGLMVGLGETPEEVLVVMAEAREAGCSLLTIGQYFRPRRTCLPVERYVDQDEYRRYRQEGRDLGFEVVAAGPFVRSSYQAREVYSGSA